MAPYIWVVALGLLVGFSELFSRYRDRPSAVLLVPSSWLYAALNGAASAAALRLAESLDWTFGQESEGSVWLMRVVICGLGAMAVLRSSFTNIKAGDAVVSVGPALLLSNIMDAADRGVDRVRSERRIRDAAEIMKDVSFEKARDSLTTSVLSAMQNTTSKEQVELRTVVDALDASGLSDSQKSLNLGLALLTLVGPKALRATVMHMQAELRADDGVPAG